MVAVGGGVVCDVVGLAASLYARGVPYVKINTTLVGQVDVGVANRFATPALYGADVIVPTLAGIAVVRTS